MNTTIYINVGRQEEMGTVSKNFSYHEFEDSDIAKRYHINNTITSFEVRDSIKALVENILQPLRDAWGEPLIINSGYRSKELNEHPLIEGSSTSQHCLGEAADVRCDDPLSLARLVIGLGLDFDQMGLYPTFVHLSFTERRKNRNQIFYSPKYQGEKV